jgi:hypothetical protein
VVTLRAPIVVSEHGDVSVFASVETAARKLEPIDVENGEYVAYDGDGFLLQLVPTHPKVTIGGRMPLPARTEELHDLINGFFERVEPGTGPGSAASLQELLVHFIQRFGYTA